VRGHAAPWRTVPKKLAHNASDKHASCGQTSELWRIKWEPSPAKLRLLRQPASAMRLLLQRTAQTRMCVNRQQLSFACFLALQGMHVFTFTADSAGETVSKGNDHRRAEKWLQVRGSPVRAPNNACYPTL